MSRTRKPKANLPDCIVVGVDETDLADDAARMAIELGRRLGAPVEIVHAVDLMPGLYPRPLPARLSALLAEASDAIRARLGPLLERSSRARRGGRSPAPAATASARAHESRVRVVEGPPSKILLDSARGKKRAWIVLGRDRKRGTFDFGSTLRAVFAKSHGPVWVQSSRIAPIKRILAPVDLSEESLSALATACALARVFKARVRVVYYFHVSPLAIAGAGGSTLHGSAVSFRKTGLDQLKAFERAMRRFDWQGAEHSAVFLEGEPVSKILQSAHNADLVVLGSHGRSGLASVLLGGTAYAVLKRAKKPVLVVRAPGRKFLIR